MSRQTEKEGKTSLVSVEKRGERERCRERGMENDDMGDDEDKVRWERVSGERGA